MGCGAWCSGLVCRTDGGRRAEHACERQVGITPGQESSLEGVTHSRTGWPLQAGGAGPLCGEEFLLCFFFMRKLRKGSV